MAFEAGNKIKVKTYGEKKNRLSENKKEKETKKMKQREEKNTSSTKIVAFYAKA